MKVVLAALVTLTLATAVDGGVSAGSASAQPYWRHHHYHRITRICRQWRHHGHWVRECRVRRW